MGPDLLDRLRAWWRRRFGSGPAEPGDGSDADAEPAFDYECAVCGTGVDGPDAACPLCRSTDVVRAGAAGDAPASGERELERRAASEEDAAVERLRELREDDEVLAVHDDRWEPVDGGYRVETSDGTRVVDSREEVAALLRAEDDRSGASG